MKKITSLLVIGLALVLSCTKEGPATVNKIDDLYTVPTDAQELPALTKAESTWSVDRRYFDLTFGNALSTTLVGYDPLLTPGQYVLGADEIGKAVLAKTKINGAAAKQGFIVVNEKDGKYTIAAQIDGTVFNWKGTLPFEPDPDPVELSVVLDAKANTGDVTTLTLNLATEGISKGYNEYWQEVWEGEGGYLALDLNTGDKYLVDGNYAACAVGGVVNKGEFGIGWDPGDIYSIGYEFTNWGTCWWDVADGAATATKITEGLVVVSSREEKVDDKDVTIWTIYWGVDYPKEYVFEGQIPALTKPKKPAGPVAPTHKYTIGEPQVCMLNDNTTIVEGVKKYPFTITDANDKEVAYLELVLVDGAKDATAGDYVSTEYAHEVGQLANGYYLDFGEWGVFAGGSYYWSGDEKVYIAAGETVSVVQIGTGAFEFIGTGFDFPAAGPNYVPGEGGGGDDDVTGDVVLKLTSGLTYSMEDITASNTDSSQNPLSGMTLWRVVVSDSDGEVAEFDLGTAEGSTDLAGEYTVMSYPDAVGKAGNGWGWIPYMKGGCYFLIGEDYYWIPSGNTITVSNNSDGTLKIKMEGPILNADNTDGGQGGLLLNNIAKS